MSTLATTESEPLQPAITQMLAEARLSGKWLVTPFLGAASGASGGGGGNNRVYKLALADRSFLLKCYFRHPQDPRDRLRAEFAFTRFAWSVGLRCVPEPIACSPPHGLALYEFIGGRKPVAEDVTPQRVQDALAFVVELNQHRQRAEAAQLPLASEACFSFAQHLACVDHRLTRLQSLPPTSAVDHAVLTFLEKDFAPVWQRIAPQVRAEAQRLSLPWDEPLPLEHRWLSPSDFGFHNALLAVDGRTRFIDFEYAGWDDPVKIVCDFFTQVAVPVPLDYFEDFLHQVTARLAHPAAQAQQARLLLNVYRCKWICLVLNEFSPIALLRRDFARNHADTAELKQRQLNKARQLLNTVHQTCGYTGGD